VGIEGSFAYDTYRLGQRELAQRTYEACLQGQTLVAEAMSGFGKTAAVLAGAVAAGEETGCKVVYVCRTKRQIQRVVEEIARLQAKRPLKAGSMLSKFDYCLLKRQRPMPRESFGWYCSFNISNNLCSYFLNVPLAGVDFDSAVAKALRSTPSHSELLRQSESIHVCPYEVARLAMVQADVAVAPYHYVFDPKASPVLFDRNLMDRKKTILVVDEAHNLRDFFRGVTSATLTTDQLQGAVREAGVLLMDDAAASIGALKRTLEEAAAGYSGWRLDRGAILRTFEKERGAAWLQNLAFELSSCSNAAWGSVMYERRMPSLILHVGEFLSMLSSSTETVLVKWKEGYGLIDPNPTGGLSAHLRRFRSAILVSATINPSSMFMKSLGLDPEATATYEVSSEPFVTVKTAIDTGVTTRYKSRTPEMFAKISDRVSAVIEATDGGVGIFVPSYAILGVLSEMISKRVQNRNLLSEARGLTGQEAADIFESYRSTKNSVLLGVQGGRFSEGEDFNNDSMKTVVVVGLSLPPPTPMLYAEYACLKRADETNSYMMLARLPALRKAFQAAGRHIRSPGKRGLVVLLDDRFSSLTVVNLMPSWLRRDIVVGNLGSRALTSLSHDFWASN
jgi:DNA excision repair protein ERCC-2